MFYVVRHSERMDDVDPDGWEQYVQQLYGEAKSKVSKAIQPIHSRKKVYFSQDPPLSRENGLKYATNASDTLYDMVGRQSECSDSVFVVRLYSSKLRRSVQTAVPIAKKFNIPIILSRALSCVISGVKKAGEKFEFQSIEDWQTEFPGVEFIDTDTINYDFPRDNWINAVDFINRDPNALNIIVAHRETIKGLAGTALQTPYCCIGIFDGNKIPAVHDSTTKSIDKHERSPPTSNAANGSTTKKRVPIYHLATIVDRFGNSINIS